MAIQNAPSQKATLKQIFNWIQETYPYFQKRKSEKGWKNSIRRILNFNEVFCKTRIDKKQAWSLKNGIQL